MSRYTIGWGVRLNNALNALNSLEHYFTQNALNIVNSLSDLNYFELYLHRIDQVNAEKATQYKFNINMINN